METQPPQDGVRVEESGGGGVSCIPSAVPKEARTEKKHRSGPKVPKQPGEDDSSSSDSDDDDVPGPPTYDGGAVQQQIQQVQQLEPTAPKFMCQSATGHVMSVEFYPVCLKKGNSRLDIPPRCEPFSTLMQQANHWLQAAQSYRCLRCETVLRPIGFDGAIDYSSSHTRGSKFGSLVFTTGLRMWVTERTDIPPQQLWYVNVLPKPQPAAANSTLPEFDDLRQTCEYVNQQFALNPIPGVILNMEQKDLLFQRWTNRKNIDLDKTVFLMRQDSVKTYVISLRIYYVIGQPLIEKIGVVTLLPEVTHRSGMQRPKVDGHSTLVQKAIKWIAQNQANVRVTDLQSFRMFVNIDGGDRKWQKWLDEEDPYRTLSLDRSWSGTSFAINTIRIIFTHGGPAVPLIQSGLLSTKVFTPYKFGEQSYETVQQTCSRIAAWMNLARPRIVSAETIEVSHQAAAEEINHDCCDAMFTKLTNHSYVTCFRFYIDGVVEEPPAHALPPPPLRQQSSCCVVL